MPLSPAGTTPALLVLLEIATYNCLLAPQKQALNARSQIDVQLKRCSPRSESE